MHVTTSTMMPGMDSVKRAVDLNNGHCPCKIERSGDTRCPCKGYREQEEGLCDCGLYFKKHYDVYYVLYTREGCPRCKILKDELEKAGMIFVESTDYSQIKNTALPVLVDEYAERNFKEAMDYISFLKGEKNEQI